MATDDSQNYMVRDPQGNVYGPADIDLLEQWIMQGRIIAGMHIAPRETGEWAEVSTHPALAHLFPEEAPPQEVPPTIPGLEQPPPIPTAAPPTPNPAPIPAAPTSNYPVTPVIPTASEPLPYASTGPRQNMPALLSLGAGILAVLSGAVSPCLCVSPLVFLTGMAAIIAGGIALSQMKADASRYTGRGQAIAGLLLGIGGILLAVGFIVGAFALHFRAP